MGEHRKKGKTINYINRGAKQRTTLYVIAAIIIVVAGINLVQRIKVDPLSKFEPSRTKGSAEASLKILEFVDFQCSNCAQGAKILSEYMGQHPDDIQLSMKYYPLGALNSLVSAVYAECAARQDKFWEYSKLLFTDQSNWRTMLKVRPILKKYAKEVNVDFAQFETCVEDEKIKNTVESDKAIGESHFVKMTPTYFVNGEMIVGVAALINKLEEHFGVDEESQ